MFRRTQGSNRPIGAEHPWVHPEDPSVRLNSGTSRGMRNTGTKSHDSDWPTPQPAVPMQVSRVDPSTDRGHISPGHHVRQAVRRAAAGTPSTAVRLPPAVRVARRRREPVEPWQVRAQWVWVGWRCRKPREPTIGMVHRHVAETPQVTGPHPRQVR